MSTVHEYSIVYLPMPHRDTLVRLGHARQSLGPRDRLARPAILPSSGGNPHGSTRLILLRVPNRRHESVVEVDVLVGGIQRIHWQQKVAGASQ
jgi:hypothetical protein